MTNAEQIRRFERALAHAGNTHTIGDVMDKVREGRAACWPNGNSVVVTEVLAFPQRRVCNYWIVAGDMRECVELQPRIDAWAIEHGCTLATGTGRLGWLRLSKTPLDPAWRVTGVKLVKELRT